MAWGWRSDFVNLIFGSLAHLLPHLLPHFCNWPERLFHLNLGHRDNVIID